MAKPSKTAAKPEGATFKNWYDENAEKLATKRRTKYQTDPATREAAKERSRAYRAERAKGGTITRQTYRIVKGKRTRVYTVGEIAQAVGRSTSNLRLLISKGEVPSPTLEGAHRHYTLAEFNAIKKLLSKR